MIDPLPKTTAAGPSFFSSYSEVLEHGGRTRGKRCRSPQAGASSTRWR